jgi:hypothetical protein
MIPLNFFYLYISLKILFLQTREEVSEEEVCPG